MKKSKMILFAGSVCTLFLFGFSNPAEAAEYKFDIENGDIALSVNGDTVKVNGDATEYSLTNDEFTIVGTSTTNNITVTGQNDSAVKLNLGDGTTGLSIKLAKASNKAAIALDDAKVKITGKTEGIILASGDYHAGIEVPVGSSLAIAGGNFASITAGGGAAGIGGGIGANSGAISIEGTTALKVYGGSAVLCYDDTTLIGLSGGGAGIGGGGGTPAVNNAGSPGTAGMNTGNIDVSASVTLTSIGGDGGTNNQVNALLNDYQNGYTGPGAGIGGGGGAVGKIAGTLIKGLGNGDNYLGRLDNNVKCDKVNIKAGSGEKIPVPKNLGEGSNSFVSDPAADKLSINVSDEVLAGFEIGATYKIYFGTSNTTGTLYKEIKAIEATTLPISNELIGTTFYIEKVGSQYAGKAFKTLARPAKPTGLKTVAPTSATANDGKISGVTDKMEYKADEAKDWTDVKGTTIEGLASGDYEVRVKAVSTETKKASNPFLRVEVEPLTDYFSSEVVIVSVPDYTPPTNNNNNNNNNSSGGGTAVTVTPVKLYRAYNPNSGEHLYTTDEAEFKAIVAKGWTDEGVAWKTVSSGQSVYRLYNPNSGEHFYTLDLVEYEKVAAAGWKQEGLAFYSDLNKGIPVFRLFNPNAKGAGSHHFTTNAEEVRMLVAKGWKDEGTAFYGTL